MKISWHFKRRQIPAAAPAVTTPKMDFSAAEVTPLVTSQLCNPNSSHQRQIDFLSPLDHIRGRRTADFGNRELLWTPKRSRRRRTR